MPSHTPSPPLTVAVVAALWVSWGQCGVSGSPGTWCDNGKLSLDIDLPDGTVSWGCPMSAWSTQTRPSIDTVHDPEQPDRQICMNESISYNTTIPNSGAYRPVPAESGEYLYCPPQRWLNNVHHGATALLYHPCAPHHEHQLLSALGRSCLPHYILTPHPQLSEHMPIALVSWGRTLELSTMACMDVCDWLETTTSTRNTIASGVSQGRKYNLLLMWSAEQHRHPEDDQVSLRRCCQQTISSMLKGAMEAEPETHMKRESSKHSKGGGKIRQIRAAIVDKQQNLEENKTRTNPGETGEVDSANSPLTTRTLSNPAGQVGLLSEAKSLTSMPQTPSGSNVSEAKDSAGFRAPDLQKSRLTSQITAQQPRPDHTDLRNPKPSVVSDPQHGDTARPKALTQSFKDEGKDSRNVGKETSIKKNNSKEKHSDTDSTAEIKKDQQGVDVKERELENKQKQSDARSHQNSEKNSYKSVSKSKSESSPQQQSASYQPNNHDCDGCTESQDLGAEVQAVLVNQALPRTPRTDEAVWAAAALGFLLVLLTLSVLHTRLYRHWRTTPSLYWHDPEQDYDSVADVIRRRLQISKRRRKRGRRQECVLLPSSSSSDDDP